MVNGKEPLTVFLWLRNFGKVCDDNELSEGMSMCLIPNLFAGDTEARLTRNLLRSDIGQRSLGYFPAAVNWLVSIYAEPHALGLTQDKDSGATLVDNHGVDAVVARQLILAKICGNIHSEEMMKQQLIKGLPEYLRKDAFAYNSAQRSYQQLPSFVGGKYRAA